MFYSKALGASLALLCVSFDFRTDRGGSYPPAVQNLGTFDAKGWCLTKTIREHWAALCLSVSASHAAMTFVCTNTHASLLHRPIYHRGFSLGVER